MILRHTPIDTNAEMFPQYSLQRVKVSHLLMFFNVRLTDRGEIEFRLLLSLWLAKKRPPRPYVAGRGPNDVFDNWHYPCVYPE